jgi:hypothetical protein
MGGYMNKLSYLLILLLFASSMHAAQMAESKDAAALLEEFDTFMIQRGTSAKGSKVILREVERLMTIKPALATDLLHRVAPSKNIEAITYLINNGADIFAKEYGYDLERHLENMTPRERQNPIPEVEQGRKQLLEFIQKQKSSTVFGVPGGAK